MGDDHPSYTDPPEGNYWDGLGLLEVEGIATRGVLSCPAWGTKMFKDRLWPLGTNNGSGIFVAYMCRNSLYGDFDKNPMRWPMPGDVGSERISGISDEVFVYDRVDRSELQHDKSINLGFYDGHVETYRDRLGLFEGDKQRGGRVLESRNLLFIVEIGKDPSELPPF